VTRSLSLALALALAFAQPALAQTREEVMQNSTARPIRSDEIGNRQSGPDDNARPLSYEAGAPLICRVEWWRCSSLHADEGICRPPGHIEGRYCVDEYPR
jgi:hypothetical protein